MKAAAITIPTAQSCFEAAVRMRRTGVHHLPAVDDGRVEGVITDRDLRSFLFSVLAQAYPDGVVSVDNALHEAPVRDVMSAPAITIGPEEPLATAILLMAERKIGSVPVVDRGRLVGILTETDLIHLLFRRRIFCCADVEGVLLPVA